MLSRYWDAVDRPRVVRIAKERHQELLGLPKPAKRPTGAADILTVHSRTGSTSVLQRESPEQSAFSSSGVGRRSTRFGHYATDVHLFVECFYDGILHRHMQELEPAEKIKEGA